MSFTTMALNYDFWFIKPNGMECTCEECYSKHMTERVLKMYADKGLVLEHGMIVSLIHCKMAMEIMHDRLHAPNQPPKLELLAAWTVQDHMAYRIDGKEEQLPLPTPIIERIKNGTYDDAWDWEHWNLFDTACKLPGILWRHLGCQLVVDGTEHPDSIP